MKKGLLRTPAAVSGILLIMFAGAFAAYNTSREGSSSAGTVSCEAGGTLSRKFFLSDIPAYETKFNRVVANPVHNVPTLPGSRSFTLPDAIAAGKYQVFAISAETHFNHRSTEDNRNKDVVKQWNESYYVEIDGKLTPGYAPDFTDYYDWAGGPGERLTDVDKDIDTVPEVVRNSWKGADLGVIETDTETNVITVKHRALIEPGTSVGSTYSESIDSITPSAILIECVDVATPTLEINKSVDANRDGTFNDVLESTNVDDTIRWKVIGKNSGTVADPGAKVFTCAPEGTTITSDSYSVSGGVQTGTISVDAAGCATWTGVLAPGETVELIYDTVLNNFTACDTADGTVDSKCTSDAVIFSSVTGTTKDAPADTDDAAVNILASALSVTKEIDGNFDEDTDFNDIKEQIVADGGAITYKITGTNAGPGVAKAARILDGAIAGLVKDKASATASTGAVTIDAAGVLVWNGDLAVGKSVTITYKASVADVAAFNACDAVTKASGVVAGDGNCTNITTIGTADPAGPQLIKGQKDTDIAHAFVVLEPSLTIKKYSEGIDADDEYSDDAPELIAAGTAFKWRVQGCNVGDASQKNARIVDVLPDGVDYVAVDNFKVDDTAGAKTDVKIVDIAGKKYLVWDGELAVNQCVEFDYSTTIADEAAYDECLASGPEKGGEPTCGSSAAIGQKASAAGAKAIDFEQGTDLYDPAFVKAMFESELQIKEYVDGNKDGTYDDALEEIAVGVEYQYKIVGCNVGNALDSNVRITDISPENVRFIAQGNSDVAVTLLDGAVTESLFVNSIVGVPENPPPVRANSITWNGALPPDACVEIVFNAIVDDEAAYLACVGATQGENCRDTAKIGHPASGLVDVEAVDEDPADVVANPTGDLTITKEVDVDGDGSWSKSENATYDEDFTWRIVVSNQGDGAVSNAAMLDVMPAGVSVDDQNITVTPDTGTVSVVNDRATQIFWTVGQLGAGESVTITIPAKIANAEAFDVCDGGEDGDGTQDEYCTDEAFVGTGTNRDDFSDKDNDTAQVGVVREADLTINKVVDGNDENTDATQKEQITPDGTPFEWRTTFTNNGDGVAENVTFTDRVPTGLTYISHAFNPDDAGEATYSEDGGIVSWTGDLDPGESVTFALVTKANNQAAFEECDAADGTDDDLCVNTARLSYNDVEIEDDARVDTPGEVQGEKSPLLSIEKLVDGNEDGQFNETEEIAITNLVKWRVVAQNTGDGDAAELVLSDTLNDGVAYVDGSIKELEGADLGVAQVSDGKVVWKGDLPAGSKVVITFETVFGSVSDFTDCNNSDGTPSDRACTNAVTIGYEKNDTPEDSDDASVTTKDLGKVLAYTGVGEVNFVVIIGVVMVAITLATAVIAYVTRPRNIGGTGGNAGGGLAPITISPGDDREVIEPEEHISNGDVFGYKDKDKS